MGHSGALLTNSYILLNIGSGASAVASPLAGYGTIGVNDSGGVYAETWGWTKFKFQLVSTGTVALSGMSISIYATVDPAARQTYEYAIQGRTPSGQSALPAGGSAQSLRDRAAGYYPGIPASSWSLLDGLIDQTGSGLSANPLTATTPWFTGQGPIVALRAVLTASASPAGSFSVAVMGAP